MHHLPDSSTKRATPRRHRISSCAKKPPNFSLITHPIATAGIILTAIVVLSLNVRAQAPVSVIRGIITDSSGSPISDTTITVKEIHTGWVRATVSHSEGAYQIADLPPGDYEITVAATTFATSMQIQTLQVG